MKYERYTMNKLDSIIDFIGEYVYPIAIDYDIDNDWIWVVERNHFGMGYISKIDAISHNVLFRKEGFNALWVEVDPVTHYCWVADQENSLVAKISPDGNAQRFSGFLDPSCVSVEPAVAVWVADAGHSEIVKLSYDGTELFRVTGVVDSATAVEVDPNDGSCWVSDAGNNRVIKLSATGNMLFEITDFIIPMGLSLSPAPDPE
jgi:DNA-binding beta-propeller fold protein YncE